MCGVTDVYKQIIVFDRAGKRRFWYTGKQIASLQTAGSGHVSRQLHVQQTNELVVVLKYLLKKEIRYSL